MANFETALERALALVQQGKSPEEALQHYPQFRDTLEPMLMAAAQLRSVEVPSLSPSFKTRTRAELEARMSARPRAGRSAGLWRRLATTLATCCFTLAIATTALAQSAVPGDGLHPVKLYSEQVWRSLHSNPVQADLILAQRRLEELLAVEGDPERVPDAMSAYAASLDTLRRDLEALPNRALSAQTVLHAQREQMQAVLEAAGSTTDEFFTILPTVEDLIISNPVQVPLSTPEQIQLVVPVVPVVPNVSIAVGQPGDQPSLSVEVSTKDEGLNIILGTQLLNDIADQLKSLTAPEK